MEFDYLAVLAMNRNCLLSVCLCVIAFSCICCGLQEIPNGEKCEGNTVGRYANDAFSEYKTDKASQTIIDTGHCIENYSYCLDNALCSFCPKGTFYVKKDDSKTEYTCLTCEEIEECDSRSCAIAFSKCNAEYCVQKCENDLLTTCEDGKQHLTECQNGCNLDGTDCSLVRVCPKGAVFVDDVCVCDEANHWTGSAGECNCSDGYFEKYGDCIQENSCHDVREVFDEESKSCLCRTENHWSGEADQCDCESGYVLNHSQCIEADKCDFVREVYDSSTDTCHCNAYEAWTGEAGSCACRNHFVEKNGKCVFDNPCDPVSESYDYSAEICICNELEHWTGEAGSCRCSHGYLLTDGKCVSDDRCNWNEKYDEAKSACVCNEDAHWKGEAGNCSCVSGFIKQNNTCVKDKSCNPNEIFDDAQNKCVCDKDRFWTGDAGSCRCVDGYNKIENACIRDKSCGEHEVFSEEANGCVCDGSKFWVKGENGCVCADKHIQKGDVCEPLMSCHEPKEVNDQTTNSCVCNGNLHWTGTPGACGCALGYKVQGDSCVMYSPGEMIQFGQYPQNNAGYNEPVNWRILDVKTEPNRYLLITEKGIDDVRYHAVEGADCGTSNATWATSDIRGWLNNAFYKVAFDDKQREHIILSHVVTPENWFFHTPGGPDTDDYLFLLSYEEYDRYLSSSESRMAFPTPYAIQHGAQCHDHDGNFLSHGHPDCGVRYHGWWLLRTPGKIITLISFVRGDGVLFGFENNKNGDCANSKSAMTRPAMWAAF